MFNFQNFDEVFFFDSDACYDAALCDTIIANRKQLEGLLIDNVLKDGGIKRPAKYYPPKNNADMRALHKAIIESTFPDQAKVSVLYYILLHFDASTGGRVISTAFEESAFLPKKYQITMKGLLHFDQREFKEALEYLTHPSITPEYTEHTLENLVKYGVECSRTDGREDFTLALTYYHSLQPVLKTLSAVEHLFSAIARTSVTEAFYFCRGQPEHTQRHSFEMLISVVLQNSTPETIADRGIELINLPFSKEEESWFEEYLLRGGGHGLRKAKDIVILRRIATGKFEESLEVKTANTRTVNGLNWNTLANGVEYGLGPRLDTNTMSTLADAAVAEATNTNNDDHQTSVQDGDNKFQKAISAWRTIDLTSLIPSLDNTASEIVQYQRDSTVQRKDLAQKTKDFRKLDDAGKLAEVKGLLKAYQTFIDLLTNHSKSTNSAFLQVYSSLSEAPDPYPLLEASVDSLLLSEDTLPKVTQENEHLQKSVSKLTSQLEETEARLETERSARRTLEEGLETKVKEVETSWAAVLEEKKDNWEAKEKLLEDKVETQDRLLTEIKASYEVTQRLGQADGDENGAGRGHVTSAELEMVNSDLERTSVRLAEVEARNEQLLVELAQTASQVPSQPALNLEDDPGYMRLRSENSSLLRKVDAARVEKDARKRELDGKMRALERETALLKDERDALKSKVQKWSDYEDIKQELEVLKSIEFSTGDDDELDVPESAANVTDGKVENGSSGRPKGDTLEQLLLARNKKLSDELTILRVSHQDLQNRLQAMQEELSKTNGELERAQHLNATLENDLANVQQETANAYPSGASVAGTYVSRYPQSSANVMGGRKGRISPTSSIISGFDPRSASLGTTSLEALRSGEPVGGGSGILPMITAQRDRFKKRNAQLENELSETHRTVSSLRQEIASLQKDNLNLYEKTRYVSTYNRGAPTASSASSYASNPNPSTVQMSSSTSSGLALDRYRSAYESNISPFAAFRGRESARAYKRMSLPERVVFSITRMVLATRSSRNLFAGYCVALHVLVFFSLYYTMTGTATAAAGPLAAKVAGEASKAGKDTDWHQEGFSGKGS
ncbi:hypothetical protein HYFRA_00009846 [Hymenoscyphus fraxineus]|uniref:Protein CASP n=1 Tax=Hymenoscyphus fraxineus TaxID=746836 RepID=A0A9N9L4P6_9HELO|nr:hypothetical protein HYFRA_00009846 [Hymenoscyphus fraxineus]